ncbi:PucR family transcriptional regulator [Amycolatopsis jejuensis]|uniref:PucR family transcriptional regulator n=1 Tax=Amycolatopsis jejuensis TaxID=330084 RepID=UPI000527BA95|nr:helix-turn-helix domain-containing protein [Amycolatopsis jejuensis]
MTDNHLDDLVEAVDAIARIVGGPVVIEDVDFRVLAYSAVPGQPNDEARREAILNRRTPDFWVRRFTETGVRQRLLATDEVIALDMLGPSFTPRLITGIPVGDTVVGFLWAMEGDAPLPADVADIMRQFAVAVGPELARRSPLLENPQSHLLRQFLAGAIPARQLAEALCTTEDTDAVVVAIGIPADSADEIILRSRALKVLNLHVTTGHRRPWLVATIDQQIYLLGAASAGHRIEERLTAVVRHLEGALGVPVFAAAGSVQPLLGGTARSRAEADLALKALRANGEPVVGSYERLRFEAVLHETGEFLESQPVLTGTFVDDLVNYDRTHGTEYLATLRAYLDAFGDIRSAADVLHIHPNSLRYRIKRLAELAAVDLGDARARLAVQLLLLARPDAG